MTKLNCKKRKIIHSKKNEIKLFNHPVLVNLFPIFVHIDLLMPFLSIFSSQNGTMGSPQYRKHKREPKPVLPPGPPQARGGHGWSSRGRCTLDQAGRA